MRTNMKWQRHNRQCVGAGKYKSQAVSGLAKVQEPGSVRAGKGTRARQCQGWQSTRARQCRGWQSYKSQAVSGLAELQEPGSVGAGRAQELGSVGAGRGARARQCRGWPRYKSQAVCRARQLLLIASPELGQGGVRMERRVPAGCTATLIDFSA